MKVKLVKGGPAIDMLNPRLSTTFENITSCELPRLVVIFPFAPSAIGPSTCAEEILVFQRLQLFGSHQMLQTLSGDALVVRETP